MITAAHYRLIRTALSETPASAEQRSAIRKICAELVPVTEPEKILIEFKAALDEAADAEHVRYGVERNAIVSRIVSTFIAELYAASEGAQVTELSTRSQGGATAPHITLKADSPAVHL